mmetsp:Transcript_61007/g.163825  ORF Transcript_61007/g.163825 Transcript_61007/m.163825 type:complete len:342 (-) Transcript_61007:259-1284(-)
MPPTARLHADVGEVFSCLLSITPRAAEDVCALMPPPRTRASAILTVIQSPKTSLGSRGRRRRRGRREQDVVHLVHVHGDLHLVVVLAGEVAGILFPQRGAGLGVRLKLGLLVLELGLEALEVGLLGLELSLKLSLLRVGKGRGGLDVLAESVNERLVRRNLGLDVGDLSLVGVLNLELLVERALVGLGGLVRGLLLSLLDGLGVQNGLAIGNGIARHLLVLMKGSDVVLDLHHLALENLEGVLKGQNLLIQLSGLLGGQSSLLLLVHVDLIELLLSQKLQLGKSLLQGELVGNISFIIAAVLGNLGLQLGLKLLGVGNSLNLLLQVSNLRLKGIRLSSSPP